MKNTNTKTNKNQDEKKKSSIEKSEKVKKIETVTKDSNAVHEGAKFRVSFLVGQFFRGRYYHLGSFIVLSENDAKAYKKRSTLKIEPLK